MWIHKEICSSIRYFYLKLKWPLFSFLLWIQSLLLLVESNEPFPTQYCLGFSDSYTQCDNQDDGLGPIAKLEKYAASENIFNR